MGDSMGPENADGLNSPLTAGEREAKVGEVTHLQVVGATRAKTDACEYPD